MPRLLWTPYRAWHEAHSVRRLPRALLPPSERGTTWSTASRSLLPHMTQAAPSRSLRLMLCHLAP
jgi:hypothetical protein